MSHFNWVFFSDSYTTCYPFRQIWHNGDNGHFQKIPPACCTNTMSYNVNLVALSQYRYRWLHSRVLEREKDQWTRLSRSSSALLDFEVSLYNLLGHRPPTTVLQRLRSWAILSIFPKLHPTSSMSAMRSSLHELFGLPLFLFPCGFHVRACRVMLDAGFRSGCPIQPMVFFLFRFQWGLALFAANVLHCRWFL